MLASASLFTLWINMPWSTKWRAEGKRVVEQRLKEQTPYSKTLGCRGKLKIKQNATICEFYFTRCSAVQRRCIQRVTSSTFSPTPWAVFQRAGTGGNKRLGRLEFVFMEGASWSGKGSVIFKQGWRVVGHYVKQMIHFSFLHLTQSARF